MQTHLQVPGGMTRAQLDLCNPVVEQVRDCTNLVIHKTHLQMEQAARAQIHLCNPVVEQVRDWTNLVIHKANLYNQVPTTGNFPLVRMRQKMKRLRKKVGGISAGNEQIMADQYEVD
jgi:hypothetical protein